MSIIESMLAAIQSRDFVECPHCGHSFNLAADSERACGHVTYHGEDEPKPEDCPNCGVTIYLQEHVSRWWSVGRTPDEASEL